jgi:hypothetical protein
MPDMGSCYPAAASSKHRRSTKFMSVRHNSDARAADTRAEEDEETPAERLEREHEELFHELRSIIPGAEVLFAFLLTVAFTERMETLTSLQRGVYYGTFMCAGVALVLLLGPSAFHRVQFRQRDKDAMMRTANVEAIIALALISLSIAGAVFLITDLLFATVLATVIAVAIWSVASTLWWIVPLSRRVK